MKTAFMFPGQGSQQVGMGRDLADNLPDVAELFRRANEIVEYDLKTLCFEGPAERLDTTEVSQPAIFVTSVACLMALRQGRIADVAPETMPDACLGLSLGEYTALYVSGALAFEKTLELVQLRGRAMQAAAQQRKGAMVSILGLEEDGIQRLCRAVLEESPREEDGREPLLVPVNYNCPGQIVLSGSIRACRRAEELAEQYGASRAVPLRVSGAFHTEMMQPAAKQLGDALQACPFSKPRMKVIANVDGQAYDEVQQIPEKLRRQLVSAVRWQQSIELLLDEGIERFIEIGPGRVLTGLLKKISRVRKQKVKIITVNGLA